MASHAACLPASLVLVMGVSGSGKTVIAGLLAQLLQWELLDADAFHPSANVSKLGSGIALTDEDRWPWLQAVSRRIDELRAAGRHAVVACSALKRSYRDVLIGGRKDARLVYLKGEPGLIRQRLQRRQGHFMPAALLQSQFDTLEEPQADERALVVAIDAEPRVIAAEILARLRAGAPS